VQRRFILIRKKDVLKSIALSFPEKSKKEVGFISKNIYKTFIMVLLDMFLS
jgi:lauroyl/myristoyl acyltransferase